MSCRRSQRGKGSGVLCLLLPWSQVWSSPPYALESTFLARSHFTSRHSAASVAECGVISVLVAGRRPRHCSSSSFSAPPSSPTTTSILLICLSLPQSPSWDPKVCDAALVWCSQSCVREGCMCKNSENCESRQTDALCWRRITYTRVRIWFFRI